MMKKSKKLTVILIALVSYFILLSGCGGGSSPGGDVSAPSGGGNASGGSDNASTPAADSTYIIRIGAPTGGKHSANYTVERFAEEIEAASNGSITAEFYPAGQLGTVTQMMESVLDGSLQGVTLPLSYFVTVAPATAIIDMPFLFDADLGEGEQCFRILNAGTSLDQYIRDKGFVAVVWGRSGMNYYMMREPVQAMSDFKGKKIRCHTSDFIQAQISAYGGVPTMVDTGDLASSLQNGTIDGLQTDVIFAASQSIYEYSPNYTLVGSACVNTFALSSAWMDTLPLDVQNLILDTAKAIAVGDSYNYYISYEDECFSILRENDVNIIEPSAAFVDDLKAASSSIYDKFINYDADCARVYDEFTALIKADTDAHK